MRLLPQKNKLKKPLVWLEIDTRALIQNVRQMKKLVGKTKIMAVLKANAYGLGAVGVARAIEQSIDLFGVVGTKEALDLRLAGINKPVVNLGVYCSEDAQTLIKNKITPSVFTRESISELGRLAETNYAPVKIWIKIDTGLTRLGTTPSQALPLIKYASAQKNLIITGVYSTLTENPALDKKQLTKFLELKKQCEKEKIKIPNWSISSSQGAFLLPEATLEVIRLGISLLGYYPSPEAQKTNQVVLQPTATYKTKVACVKELQPGESAFYKKRFVAKQKTRLAILLPGYSYGLSPNLVNGGSVLINEKRFPLVGGISTTNCLANIGSTKNIQVNSEVVLFGRQGKKKIDLEKICEITQQNVYECLSRIPEKVERKYI